MKIPSLQSKREPSTACSRQDSGFTLYLFTCSHYVLYREDCQTACKPGSVPSRRKPGRGWPFIWGARCRAPRATDPSGGAKARPAARRTGLPAAPTWSCSRWGLPCRRRCRQRGALLPHHFTLASHAVPNGAAGSAVCFCGTFPRVAPAGRYPAPRLRGARTFLPPQAGERPSGRLASDDMGRAPAEVKTCWRLGIRDLCDARPNGR